MEGIPYVIPVLVLNGAGVSIPMRSLVVRSLRKLQLHWLLVEAEQ